MTPFQKYVHCKTWDATRPDFCFPEQSDPELQVSGLMARPNLGLAFSGGGTRSASATLGQLRGLSHLGLLDKARYLSCVSGSSLISTAFTYLPQAWDDEVFLGPVVAPADLSVEHLQHTDPDSFAHAIAHSVLASNFIKHAARLAGDETFSRTLGDVFLDPFDLNSQRRFFSYDHNSVAAILQHNPGMEADDFYQVRPGRPYLIVNSLILRVKNEHPLPRRIPFESTPLYVGMRALHKEAGADKRDVGGGYIEPFGFDSDAPDAPADASDRVRLHLGRSRYRYTLSDAIGSSCAAPAEKLAEWSLDRLGFPEFKYWPPASPGQTQAREYVVGDGGILENLGIMPLLARKVEHIIVFVNTADELISGVPGQLNTSIPPLFGQIPDFETNHVFPRSQYASLVNGLLAAKQAGNTVMFKGRYPVRENARYGVEGGWVVEVLWVYNERVPAWEGQLPAEIKSMIGQGDLENFPHYDTFSQNPLTVIDLNAKQTLMLANLSCWNVIHNKDVFLSMST